jgi:hypothetical protein
MSHSAKAS